MKKRDTIYKVHYPNGLTLNHKVDSITNHCFPSLDRVFYNFLYGYTQFFQIAEMSEEEIWVEEISQEEYQLRINFGVSENFVHFQKLGSIILRF